MYVYYNNNPYNRHIDDCVIRSISKATGESWDYVYDKLSDAAREQGVLLDSVEFVENYLDKRYKRTCHYSKTLKEFMNEYPKGTYLVTMEGHITVVIDGILYDTADCSSHRIWCVWEIKD